MQILRELRAAFVYVLILLGLVKNEGSRNIIAPCAREVAESAVRSDADPHAVAGVRTAAAAR